MRKNWGILWNGLTEAYENFYPLIFINLFWLIASLPVITIPSALAGLHYATNQLAHRQAFTWKSFWVGFRQEFWLGWKWCMTNLFVAGVLLSNLIYYGRWEGTWSVWVRGVVIGLLSLWLFFQVFTLPLLLEQVDRRMRVALRNSFVLVIKAPGVCLALVFLLLLFAILSTVIIIPWVLITASLSTFLANYCVLQLLVTIKPDEPQG